MNTLPGFLILATFGDVTDAREETLRTMDFLKLTREIRVSQSGSSIYLAVLYLLH